MTNMKPRKYFHDCYQREPKTDFTAYNNGFCASGAEGKNISIYAAIIGSPG